MPQRYQSVCRLSQGISRNFRPDKKAESFGVLLKRKRWSFQNGRLVVGLLDMLMQGRRNISPRMLGPPAPQGKFMVRTTRADDD